MKIEARADYPADWADRMARQLPFITMRALNNTAFDARLAVQADLPKRFKLKNTWTRRMILVAKASKADLVAHVTAPDYMRKQEYGGNVSPQGNHLATPELMRGKLIKAGNRPRAAMAKDDVFLLKRGGGQSIVQRRGKSGLRVLFWLTGQQRFGKQFYMGNTVEEVVHRRFAIHFSDAIQHASATGR